MRLYMKIRIMIANMKRYRRLLNRIKMLKFRLKSRINRLRISQMTPLLATKTTQTATIKKRKAMKNPKAKKNCSSLRKAPTARRCRTAAIPPETSLACSMIRKGTPTAYRATPCSNHWDTAEGQKSTWCSIRASLRMSFRWVPKSFCKATPTYCWTRSWRSWRHPGTRLISFTTLGWFPKEQKNNWRSWTK